MSLPRVIGLAVVAGAVWVSRGEAQRGFGLSLSAGISKSLAELANPRPDVGVHFEVSPEWRSKGGFGIGVGFRYTGYADVDDRESIFLDLRYTRPLSGPRPTFALRAGGFHGGDEGGDDPYIGLEIGPIGGVEVPIGERAALRVEGFAYGVLALFRGARVLPGLQAGFVLR